MEAKEMTTIKSHYRLILAILAAAFSLTLIAAGTLMLFTAQSEDATNVVTLGDASIELQEKTAGAGIPADYEDFPRTEDGYTTVGGFDHEGEHYDFGGIDFGSGILPGGKVYKVPRVVNTGDVDVYVYVEGRFTAEDPTTGDLVDFSGDSPAVGQLKNIISSLTPGGLGLGWYGDTIEYTTNGAVGTFYYANSEGTPTPLVGTGGANATVAIFDGITIPKDIGNTLSKYKISLKLTAYAVQAENALAAGETPTLETIKALFDSNKDL
jgi:predicted ribosomally synthesized peptide with SipW-like signal peptide